MRSFFGVIAYILVVVGALNWGLWGFFQFDLVAWIFGGNTTNLSRLVYCLVGIAGLWMLLGCCRSCKSVGKNSSGCCKKD